MTSYDTYTRMISHLNDGGIINLEGDAGTIFTVEEYDAYLEALREDPEGTAQIVGVG